MNIRPTKRKIWIGSILTAILYYLSLQFFLPKMKYIECLTVGCLRGSVDVPGVHDSIFECCTSVTTGEYIFEFVRLAIYIALAVYLGYSLFQKK